MNYYDYNAGKIGLNPSDKLDPTGLDFTPTLEVEHTTWTPELEELFVKEFLKS
jgi:hypothetical protein